MVLQRVSEASVSIDGRVVGAIGTGFLVLVGFTVDDRLEHVEWMAEKVGGLRVFTDAAGKMNLGLEDVAGSLLVVSQFTLYGNVQKGRRPSFVQAAPPDVAEALYDAFVLALRNRDLDVATGAFGAMMDVRLVNEGPVTLLLER